VNAEAHNVSVDSDTDGPRRPPARPLWLPPTGRIHPLWWVPVTCALIVADYFTGPLFPLPTVYIIPVLMAGWYSGRKATLVLAIVLPASRGLLLLYAWDAPWSWIDLGLTVAVRIATFMFLGLLTWRLAEHERAIERDLEVLQGLLPICAQCKSIRNTEDNWESLESYIEKRSGAEFTHGMCPACTRRYHADYFKR
jgi:hypothetical protein